MSSDDPPGSVKYLVNCRYFVAPLVRQEGELLPSVTFKTRVRMDEEGDNPV